MYRKHRSVAIPLLAHELCLEVHALVGVSGHGVLLEMLQRRLGVDRVQLIQAVVMARQLAWIETRGADSVRLLPAGMNPCPPDAAISSTDGRRTPVTPPPAPSARRA